MSDEDNDDNDSNKYIDYKYWANVCIIIIINCRV